MQTKHIIVTGANGFVGMTLLRRLMLENYLLRGLVLNNEETPSMHLKGNFVKVDPLSSESDYSSALRGGDVLIHLAARVHIMQETAKDPLQEFRNVNLHGTVQLARQAARAGVRRLVFMSTVGVNGNDSGVKPYMEGDVPRPHNPYSISKYEAELALKQISLETGIEVVIIRAPLVYGPGNPGNFFSLLRIVAKGIPLPLASIINKRSLIYVGNLVDALATCAIHPDAAGKTYLVSDGEDVSFPELIRKTASAMGMSARLLPFPASLLMLAGRIIGKSAAVSRLTGSLAVNSTKIRRELGWHPPFTMSEGLKATADWFNSR